MPRRPPVHGLTCSGVPLRSGRLNVPRRLSPHVVATEPVQRQLRAVCVDSSTQKLKRRRVGKYVGMGANGAQKRVGWATGWVKDAALWQRLMKSSRRIFSTGGSWR